MVLRTDSARALLLAELARAAALPLAVRPRGQPTGAP